MSLARFFHRPINTGIVRLTGPEAHHLARVRRLKVADRVELFDGAGCYTQAVITEVKSHHVGLRVEEVHTAEPPAPPAVIVAASLAQGRRFDWLIEKCTELGVDRICPVVYERTVKLSRSANAEQRYHQLALAAAKQCGRFYLPQIDRPAGLAACLAQLAGDYPDGQMLLGSLEASAKLFSNLREIQAAVIAFIGPEGGLTDEELSLLHQHHARSVRLSQYTLRIETAALAFAALLTGRRRASSTPSNQDSVQP